MAVKPLLKYAPLFLFQIILVVLFFVFVRYGEPKNSPGFEGTHVMIFIGFGFLMTFLKKYCYSALGFNWLLAALVIQWAMFCQNAFHMKDGKILVSKMEMVEADIMAATVLITFGALLGVASGVQLLFIAIVETAIGCANLYLVVDVLKAADAGGSIAIHTFGAYFGLGVSLAFRKKAAQDAANNPVSLNAPSYTSDVTAMIGSIFLWIYWPSFNSALVETPGEYDRAVMNTYLSLGAATVVSFIMSSWLSHDEGKFDMVHVQNSTLAGGVAVGAVCNMHIQPGGAILIGIGAGILSVAGYRFLTPWLTKKGLLDTCGVNNLHGMPGIYSGIISIIIAALATSDVYGTELATVFPAMDPKLDDPRSAQNQALMQAAALGATLLISFVTGLITGFIAKLPCFHPLPEDKRYNDEVDWELPS
ncbi:ammonium transporter Rh type B [Pectinophora gossypiella]|uniref:ammonium transporter Rh type B n=1 Tax=Pectinophora gossypiella TaxID=13191 RepID=UPI00214F174A|nr:ammonium transporter Rh type B [Pectinophora gossypiella]